MRILVAHNRYQQAGGEDAVFENEVSLLRAAGHEVFTILASNDDIKGPIGRIAAAGLVTYNPWGAQQISNAVDQCKPEVLHVHNYFPRFSPSIFYAAAKKKVPAVWTLHNYRVACAGAFLYRNGQPCQDCITGNVISAVRHKCYRNSRLGSAAVAAMIASHRAMGTWQTKVARFIALTQFSRDRLIEGGLPAEKVVVKPNFSNIQRSVGGGKREGALYVGRLSREKGVDILVDAWRTMDVPLVIIGDGPDREVLQARSTPNVTFSGWKSADDVASAMAASKLLIVPSVWYENFPMTVVEAMAVGTPVMVSALGALKEIVADGVTGLHFCPGDASDLASRVRLAFESPDVLSEMGRAAGRYFDAHLSPQENLRRLEEIYVDAIQAHGAS